MLDILICTSAIYKRRQIIIIIIIIIYIYI